jgi:hypothetical protein
MARKSSPLVSLAARAKAHTLHAMYDSRDLTQSARDASPGSDGYWERQVDPGNVLDPSERARRAGHAKKAYFTNLALASAKARRKAGAA